MTEQAGDDPALRAEVERLEHIARQLQDGDQGAEALRDLADQAIATADRISRMLPRALDPDSSG